MLLQARKNKRNLPPPPSHLEIRVLSKIHYFQPCFQGTENQKKQLTKPQQNDTKTPRNLENCLLPYFPQENLDSEAPIVEISTQKSI